MSRGRSSGGGGGGLAGLFGLLLLIGLIWAAVRAIWLYVIVPVWPLWAALVGVGTIALIRAWRRGVRDPLLVSSERRDDLVAVIVRRRPWARAFPEEARKGRHKAIEIDRDGRCAVVALFDPETEDESLLAERVGEAQETAAWWAYRMKGGADDVDKAVFIARELTERGPNARARRQPTR